MLCFLFSPLLSSSLLFSPLLSSSLPYIKACLTSLSEWNTLYLQAAVDIKRISAMIDSNFMFQHLSALQKDQIFQVMHYQSTLMSLFLFFSLSLPSYLSSFFILSLPIPLLFAFSPFLSLYLSLYLSLFLAHKHILYSHHYSLSFFFPVGYDNAQSACGWDHY